MNRTVRRKKRKFWKPVAAGFMALYLLTMGLATYLVKEKYIDEYAQAFEEIAMFLINTASEKETGVRTAETELAEKGTGGKDSEEMWGEEERAEFYQELIYGCFQSTGKQEMKGSAAVYDTEGKLLARSYDAIGDLASAISTDGQKNGPFALDDYLSFEQKEEMAEYYWKERLTA